MITYTFETRPVRKYTVSEILEMSPDRLRRELSHLCSAEPDMADKIQTIVRFEPRWSKMTTIQYAMVAMAWAYLEENDEEILKQVKIEETLLLMRALL